MKLSQAASAIKSANAGATLLTFDIVFPSPRVFEAVLASGALTPAAIAALYRLPPEQVAIHLYAPGATIKVTIPRQDVCGGVEERDFDGVQQYIPLLDIEIPEGGPARG